MQTTGVDNTVLSDKYGYTPGMKPAGGEENLFLKILTTQLKNQNPLEPLQNGDFVNQISTMASTQETATMNQQLSSLIQLQQIVAGQNAFTQSASLVGKNVKYVDPETAKQLTGVVSEVKLDDGALFLAINGKDVPMNSVIGITAAGGTDSTGGAPASDDDASN